MFKTFKASIETQVESELIKKGEAFNFNPNNPWTAEFIIQNITHEIFKFSKEDVIFSSKQKKIYKDYLRLNPFSGGVFADGVKYKLERLHNKGDTKYFIEVDELKAELKLNWYNKLKIEWVHGKKINWVIWQVTIGALALIAVSVVGYFNYIKPTNTTPPLIKDTLKGNKINSSDTSIIDKSDSNSTPKQINVGTVKNINESGIIIGDSNNMKVNNH